MYPFLLQANEESEEWGNYIQYLDGIVLDGFFNCLFCSLQFLLFNTDKEKQDLPGPLLEAKLELQAPDMFLTPTLEQVCTYNYTFVQVARGSHNKYVHFLSLTLQFEPFKFVYMYAS